MVGEIPFIQLWYRIVLILHPVMTKKLTTDTITSLM